MITSFRCPMSATASIIHLALTGFMSASRRSTGLIALLSFSCCAMLSAYHDWNFLLRKSFTGLFTLKSKGYSLSMQFGGTSTIMTFASMKSRKDFVICPLKLSKMAKAGKSLGNLISFLATVRYEKNMLHT